MLLLVVTSGPFTSPMSSVWGKYSYTLFTLALIEWRSAQAGNMLTACVRQTLVGAGNNWPSHNMYRAETVLGQRESTCRLGVCVYGRHRTCLYVRSCDLRRARHVQSLWDV